MATISLQESLLKEMYFFIFFAPSGPAKSYLLLSTCQDLSDSFTEG